jgi:arginyl-tRNA synthetase
LADLGRSGADIEVDCRPNSPVGEFVIDLGIASSRIEGEDIAASLAARPEFSRVVHRPPRVYLTPDVDFLRGCVAAAVLEGLTFVHSDAGAGGPATVTFSDPNANKPLHVGHVRNHGSTNLAASTSPAPRSCATSASTSARR